VGSSALQGRAERGPLLLLLLLSSLCWPWTLAPARLGEPLPSPLAGGARVFEHRTWMLGARQNAPDLAARARVVYGFVESGVFIPTGALTGLSCGDFINRARPGGWAGGGASAPGATHRGVGRRRARRRLAGDQADRSEAQGAPCRTYRLFYLDFYLGGLYLWSFRRVLVFANSRPSTELMWQL
jgi:hypothetical protein